MASAAPSRPSSICRPPPLSTQPTDAAKRGGRIGRVHDPVIAFMVGSSASPVLGMDAVMKGLVLSIGTTTMFWRNLVGVGMSGRSICRRRAWPPMSTMKIHVARGVLSTVMGFLFFWGLARVPLAQAIALAFIAPLVALYPRGRLPQGGDGPRTIVASLIAFAGVIVILFGQAQADLGRDACSAASRSSARRSATRSTSS